MHEDVEQYCPEWFFYFFYFYAFLNVMLTAYKFIINLWLWQYKYF